ncbi:MAG: nucleotidyltransferase family protein [Nitrospira sp.]|nr:nucleotidyltransferase family protein [Nitrospira sp.]
MQAIILAGGLGQRLKDRVPGVPKPLAPIRARPFLEHLLDYLILQGIHEVTLAIGYKGDAIKEHFGDRYRVLTIRYSSEQVPIGTGGAIRQAFGTTAFDSVFVMNGDTFVQADFRRMETEHRMAGSSMTMAIKHVDDTSRYGTVNVKSGLVCSFESSARGSAGYINAGLYLVSRTLFDGCELPDTFSFERDFLMPRVSRLRPHAFAVEGYFIDIGVPDDYERAQQELPDWR